MRRTLTSRRPVRDLVADRMARRPTPIAPGRRADATAEPVPIGVTADAAQRFAVPLIVDQAIVDQAIVVRGSPGPGQADPGKAGRATPGRRTALDLAIARAGPGLRAPGPNPDDAADHLPRPTRGRIQAARGADRVRPAAPKVRARRGVGMLGHARVGRDDVKTRLRPSRRPMADDEAAQR